MKEPYLLKPRGLYWQYRMADEPTFHSTGIKCRDNPKQKPRNRVNAVTFCLREMERRKAEIIVSERVPTIQEYAADFFVWNRCRWIKAQHAAGTSFKESTAKGRRAHLTTYIFPTFGDRPIDKLPAIELEEHLLTLPIKNATRQQIAYSYSIVTRDAFRHDVINSDPMDRARSWSMSDRTPKDRLSDDDINRLFPQTLDAWRVVWPAEMFGVLFAVMLSTGMRISEARALRWEDVYWRLRAISVLRQIDQQHEEVDPKKNEKRGVLVPRRTMRLLAMLRRYSKPYSPSGYIFTTNGGPIAAKWLQTQLERALKRANVTRHITSHSFRVTYNTKMRSLLLRGELPEEMLRHMTGHRSVAMTDYYDRPDVEERIDALIPARKQIERFWD